MVRYFSGVVQFCDFFTCRGIEDTFIPEDAIKIYIRRFENDAVLSF